MCRLTNPNVTPKQFEYNNYWEFFTAFRAHVHGTFWDLHFLQGEKSSGYTIALLEEQINS